MNELGIYILQPFWWRPAQGQVLNRTECSNVGEEEKMTCQGARKSSIEKLEGIGLSTESIGIGEEVEVCLEYHYFRSWSIIWHFGRVV